MQLYMLNLKFLNFGVNVVQYNQISQFWVDAHTNFGEIRPDDTEWSICITTIPRFIVIAYLPVNAELVC